MLIADINDKIQSQKQLSQGLLIRSHTIHSVRLKFLLFVDADSRQVPVLGAKGKL